MVGQPNNPRTIESKSIPQKVKPQKILPVDILHIFRGFAHPFNRAPLEFGAYGMSAITFGNFACTELESSLEGGFSMD